MSTKEEALPMVAATDKANEREASKKNDTPKRRGREEYICWPDRRPRKDWTGRKHGRLTFLQPVAWRANYAGGLWLYLCQCDCGQEAIVVSRKSTRSCGCLKAETMQALTVKALQANRDRKAARLAELSRLALQPGAANPNNEVNQRTCIYKGYRCDKWREEVPASQRQCYGSRCYVNERLAIGIF